MINDFDYTAKVDMNYGLLVLEPKDSFLTWVRTAGIQCEINPSDIAMSLTKESLVKHSLVIVTPVLSTLLEQENFIRKNTGVLFDAMIKSWIFPSKYWPKDRQESTLRNLFTINCFNSIVDVFNNSDEDYQNTGGMSLFVVKPKSPAIEWFQQLFADEKIAIIHESILNPSVLTHIGTVCSIAPFFSNEDKISLFIHQNYSKLFDYALRTYCSEGPVLVPDRSYEKFLQWFDCYNYSPVLSEELWAHPEILQYLGYADK